MRAITEKEVMEIISAVSGNNNFIHESQFDMTARIIAEKAEQVLEEEPK